MKPVFLSTLFVLTLVAACRRDVPVLPRQAALDTWEVDGRVFHKQRAYWRSGVLTDTALNIYGADTGTSSSILFGFSKFPVAGLDYRIVSVADSSDEVSILVFPTTGEKLHSDDRLGGTLQVRNISGKLVFIATEVRLEWIGLLGAHENICSFNLTE